jgi:hypothetical protein
MYVVMGLKRWPRTGPSRQSRPEALEKEEPNAWHVETLDTNGDGREEILNSNAKGQLFVRNANGDVIAQYLPGAYVSGLLL